MSLHQLANHMSAQGRGPDSTLVHMSPREVEGLQKLAVANGTSLTINPQTGLPEALSLKDLLPALAGAAINYFAPGFGTAIGGVLGLSGAAGTGLAVGAATAALSGDLGKGLQAGFGAYGGAGITEGLMGLGTGALSAEAGKAAVTSEMGALEADRMAENAIASKLASSGKFDTLSAGASKAMSDPMSAVKAVGGGSTGKGLAMAAAALSPLLAGETGNTVQTVTPRQSTGKIRPFTYDPYYQEYTRGTPYTAANGGLTGLAKGGSVGYAAGGTTYTPEQITSAINTSRQQGFTDADVATGLGRFITDPAAVQAAMAANPYGAASITNKDIYEPFGGASQYSNPLVNGFGAAAPTTQAAQSYTPEQITNAINTSRQQGFSDVDVATGLGRYLPNQQAVQSALTANPKLAPYNPATQSIAEYWVTQPGWTSETGGKTGIAGLNQNIANYAGNVTPTTVKSLGLSDASSVEARIRSDMVKSGVNDKDVFNATGKTVAQLAAGAFPQPIQTSINTVAPGAGGSTSAGQVGGGTVVNPNGTITTSPVIPGIPVGGFTGMTQVRDAYTKGGGDLGYTPKFVPKTIEEFNTEYKNTGYNKEMYDYLSGKGDMPTKMKNADGSFREVMRPYNEAVLQVPVNTNKPLTWDKVKGEYNRNPDYVRTAKSPILDAEGKPKLNAEGNYQYNTTTYKSVNQAKAGIVDKGLTKTSGGALLDWATTNNVDEQTVADALGIPMQEVISMFAKAKADKKIPAKNGGLMQLANGGMAYDRGGEVKSDYIDSKGDTHIWDWENGMYRPEKLFKNNKSYTWDKVSNNYKLAGADAGLNSLVDMTGGSDRGGNDGITSKSTPDWGPASRLGAFLTDKGLTSIGGYLSQAAREGRSAQQESPTDEQESSRDDTSGINGLGGKNAAQGGGSTGESWQGNEMGGPSPTGGGGYSPGTPGSPSRDSGTAEGTSVDTGTGGFTGADSNGGFGPATSGEMAKGGMIGRYAQGGLGSLGGYSDGGRLLRGPGDGVSDSIPATVGDRQPARLADGEFVVPARIVSELGNGSTEAGARALYKMMDRIQANRRKTTGKNSVAVDSKAHKYLPA